MAAAAPGCCSGCCLDDDGGGCCWSGICGEYIEPGKPGGGPKEAVYERRLHLFRQLDDGWQSAWGDWLTPHAARFPNGLSPVVDAARSSERQVTWVGERTHREIDPPDEITWTPLVRAPPALAPPAV